MTLTLIFVNNAPEKEFVIMEGEGITVKNVMEVVFVNTKNIYMNNYSVGTKVYIYHKTYIIILKGFRENGNKIL